MPDAVQLGEVDHGAADARHRGRRGLRAQLQPLDLHGATRPSLSVTDTFGSWLPAPWSGASADADQPQGEHRAVVDHVADLELA